MYLSGSITALATPFAASGELDFDAWRRHLGNQLDAGTQAVVRPLANDSDPNGDELRLTQVDEGRSGSRTLIDNATNGFGFEAANAGTYYVGYQVSDGPTVSPAVVRVDVIEKGRSQAPVADNDIATLPAGVYKLIAH